MISVRLSDSMEKKIKKISEETKLTKSDVVKEALNQYIVSLEKKETPYKLGKDLFGKHGSGDGSLSTNYKNKLKERINEKNSH